MTAQGWRKRQIMQWVPPEDEKQPEQEPVAWLTKELMANYLDTIAESIEANRSEMLRHKAHKLRDRGEV